MARRPPQIFLAAVGGYTLLACALFSPLLARISTGILADDAFLLPGNSDAFNFLWTYWWIQKAIDLGQPLLSSSWVLPPTGADLRFHTHLILPSIATYPVAKLFGTVVAYNLTILGLLVGASLSAYLFLRKHLSVSPSIAWLSGALFGFSPYFVSKAHSHPNLIGACFWVPAIGVLVDAYATSTFSRRKALVFALAIWAVYWTSMLEFVMLIVVLTALVVAAEAERLWRREPPQWRAKAWFVVLALPGVISLLPLLGANVADTVDVPMFGHGIDLLVGFPKLSLLSVLRVSEVSEYWGIYIPLTLAIPGLYGVWALWQGPPRRGVPTLTALLCFSLLLTFDPFSLFSSAIRLMPAGRGIRVLARFLPFALFFLVMFAAIGLDRFRVALTTMRTRLVLASLAIAYLVFCLEYLPVRSRPSHVPAIEVPRLRQDTFVLIVPAGGYQLPLTRDDTYQMSFDAPMVRLSYLAREAPGVAAQRQQKYPHVYGKAGFDLTDPQSIEELRELNVGYVLYENAGAAVIPPLAVKIQSSTGVLLDVSKLVKIP